MLIAIVGGAARGQAAGKQVEFFENKVRPVLVDHCYKCHGAATKHKGGLMLDSRAALLKGGDTGPAISVGRPDASLLLRAVRGADKDLKMPPDGEPQLSEGQVADLAAWVTAGAVFPVVDRAPIAVDPVEAGRTFWSLRPVKDSPPPVVRRADWPRTAIDHFILAKLEQNHLAPAGAADRRTLIRRVTYDLTGLPPTFEEVAAFEGDRSAEAYERVVDRLLASPRYGQHWARHWLDVARYADTRWVGAGEDRRMPFAYTYRDWVVGALNADMPYDRFVTLQLAADQEGSGVGVRGSEGRVGGSGNSGPGRVTQESGLSPSLNSGPRTPNPDLAALGFLTVGRWFTGNVHEVIDDQIDVVTRGLMGVTVQCARCHDHKFDPVPTRDYYSLYGLFAANRMPAADGSGVLADLPAVRPPPVDAGVEAEITALHEQLDQYLATRQAAARARYANEGKVVEYLLAAQGAYDRPDKELREFIKSNDYNEGVFTRWARLLKRTATSKDPQPVFGPWHAFAALPAGDFSTKAAEVAGRQKGMKLNRHVAAILSPPPASQAELAGRYARLFLKFDTADKPDNEDKEDEALRQVFRGGDSPVQVSPNELSQHFPKAELERVPAMRQALLQRLAKLSADADQFLAYRREVTPLLAEANAFLERRRDGIIAELRSPEKLADYLLAAHEGRAADELRLVSIANGKRISERMLARWIAYLRAAADQDDAAFAAWRAYAAVPEKEFAEKAGAVTAGLKAGKLNPHVAEAFTTPPASLKDVAARYAGLIAKFDEAAPLGDADAEAFRQVAAMAHISRDEAEDYFTRKDRDELKGKEGRLLRLFNEHPGTPDQAMVVRESGRGYAQKIFVRGNPNVPGQAAPGTFLSVLGDVTPQAFHAGRGRLELARAIVNPANPLTPRVIVNRVWAAHFGQGLVRTTSDFGTRGELPTHPELLDHLAHRFVADGWSLKKLHKSIVLSATYQQSSSTTQDSGLSTQDFFTPFPRHRLTFEETRDSLLFVTGRLDCAIGGRPDDLLKPLAVRRTIYGVVDRIALPNFYRYFDFPSSDAHTPERHETTIPQQALYLMNNTFVMDQAAHLAALSAGESSDERFVAALYRRIFGRAATAEEVALGTGFLARPAAVDLITVERAAGPWRYGFGRYDDGADRVVAFEAFGFFVNGQWRGSRQDPDPLLGRLSLNAQGGTATGDRGRSVIRRWVAPRDMTIDVNGQLDVQAGAVSPSGDGVRGRVVSSRHGQLLTVIAHGTAEPTDVRDLAVKAGDTIDFVAEGRGSEGASGFAWPVAINDAATFPPALLPRYVKPRAVQLPGGPRVFWEAARDFGSGANDRRAYGVRERYVQVLLESNEFLFLD